MSGSDQPIHLYSIFYNVYCERLDHGPSQEKHMGVERLFHKMLCVDVLYQLLLLTEAPHTVAALKELSLRPRWLSFICIL